MDYYTLWEKVVMLERTLRPAAAYLGGRNEKASIPTNTGLDAGRIAYFSISDAGEELFKLSKELYDLAADEAKEAKKQ